MTLLEKESNEEISKKNKEIYTIGDYKLKNYTFDVSEELEIELNIMKNTPIKLIYTFSYSSHDSSKCRLFKIMSCNDVI